MNCLEISEPHLQFDGAPFECIAAQSTRDLLQELGQPGLQHLAISNVFGKRRLMRNRLGLAIGDHLAVTETVGQPPMVFASRPEQII